MVSSRKAKCKRNQRGGSLGGGWGFSAASVGSGAPVINNPLTYSTGSSCLSAVRPGTLVGGWESLKTPGGLPGMNGGRRRRGGGKSRKSKSKKRQTQRGGRYGFDGSDQPTGTPWGGAMASAVKVPCEASYAALPATGPTLNMRAGELWSGATNVPAGTIPAQFGGSAPYATAFEAPTAVQGQTQMHLTVPTARYEVLPAGESSIRSAAGTNIAINRPLNWSEMSPACLKTGGGRSRKSRSRKSRSSHSRKSRSSHSRKSRSNRKSRNRKSRNRKSRQQGGGLGEDALKFLKNNNTDPVELTKSLLSRNPDGSYRALRKVIGQYTFTASGHPAQSVNLMVKETDSENEFTPVPLPYMGNH